MVHYCYTTDTVEGRTAIHTTALVVHIIRLLLFSEIQKQVIPCQAASSSQIDFPILDKQGLLLAADVILKYNLCIHGIHRLSTTLLIDSISAGGAASLINDRELPNSLSRF